MASYIISNLDQLIYIPQNKFGLKIVLETIRDIKNHNNDIFKLVHLKLYNSYICSMLYSLESNNTYSYPYVYNIEEIIDVLNKNGFDIIYQSHIELNPNEEQILQSIYDLGYYYIQCGRYLSDVEPLVIYVTKNPVNAYSPLQDFTRLDSITDKFDINDFAWLREKPYNSLSIPLLLGRQYPEPLS